jgi:hypothetical protein
MESTAIAAGHACALYFFALHKGKTVLIDFFSGLHYNAAQAGLFLIRIDRQTFRAARAAFTDRGKVP